MSGPSSRSACARWATSCSRRRRSRRWPRASRLRAARGHRAALRAAARGAAVRDARVAAGAHARRDVSRSSARCGASGRRWRWTSSATRAMPRLTAQNVPPEMAALYAQYAITIPTAAPANPVIRSTKTINAPTTKRAARGTVANPDRIVMMMANAATRPRRPHLENIVSQRTP